MITKNGYSKDPNIIPDGIVITFGKEMMDNNGGPKKVLKYFLDTMEKEDAYWMHKMLIKPKVDFSFVYIITLNRLWGRVKLGWFEKGAAFKYSPADPGLISWPRMCLIGPFEKCPVKREIKGFQGFRYCTDLF